MDFEADRLAGQRMVEVEQHGVGLAVALPVVSAGMPTSHCRK